MKVAHWQHFRPVNDNLTLHWSSVCCMLSKRISSIGLFTTEITKLFAPRKKWSIAFEFDSHDHLECPDLWRLPYVWNCKTTHFVLLSYISKTSRVELCWKTSPSAQPTVTTYLFQTVESSLYTFISCCGLFLYFLTASLTSRRTPHKSGTPNGHMSKSKFKCDQSFFRNANSLVISVASWAKRTITRLQSVLKFCFARPCWYNSGHTRVLGSCFELNLSVLQIM